MSLNDKIYSIGIITASDKGANGQREDLSGAKIKEIMTLNKYKVVKYVILPDEQEELASTMKKWAVSKEVNLILTTGGTGLAPRDVTPEATLSIAERLVPGISEVIRAQSFKITERAMLSRGVSVVCDNTLIINLPGSPKAVQESLEIILPQLQHALGILTSQENECAR